MAKLGAKELRQMLDNVGLKNPAGPLLAARFVEGFR